MISMLTGAAAGAAVCVFGLWCYVKGGNNALRIAQNGKPELFGSPVRAAAELAAAAKREKDAQKLPYEKQLRNLMAYDPAGEPERAEKEDA